MKTDRATRSTSCPVRQWLTDTDLYPFPFQEEAWQAHAAGASGLINAPTGMGKTYAAWLGPVMQWCAENRDQETWPTMKPPLLTMLWITPLRALANDTVRSLQEPIEALGLPWTIEKRTGDVSSSIKARQRKRMPTTLVTTPESLSVLLSYAESRDWFKHVQTVIIDEWHELMGTKRGTQTELGLARLRTWNPNIQTWGLSATLGNLEQAMQTLLGSKPIHSMYGLQCKDTDGVLIRAKDDKKIEVLTLAPEDIERFPWSGHLGLKLLPQVIEQIDKAATTLMFTNTRSQAEHWFHAIMRAKPDWIGWIALHHGSIDRDIREQVERLIKTGKLKCVICTSSLDLGVDFPPVDQVLQVGSPKGIARLMQRAGRSGHQPGRPSTIVGVPTHAFQLVEFAATRDAIEQRIIESRPPLHMPLDVLVQHLVTVAMGGGFEDQAMFDEVRTCYAYRDLSREQWQWTIDFIVHGGLALGAYPQYQRVVEEDERFIVKDRRIARDHRMGIGTITGDTAMLVKYRNGRTLGSVEENFVGKLQPGDRFVFAGLTLELLRVHGMTIYVKRSKRKKTWVPAWQGGKSPLSTQLAESVRERLAGAKRGAFDTPEMEKVQPLFELQAVSSIVPASDELLIETIETCDGHHAFLFPLQGRLVHEGLGSLLAYRLTQQAPRGVYVVVNDYGIQLLSNRSLVMDEEHWRILLEEERLLEDLLACVNTVELARRAFRGIARVAGLITQGFPGQNKSARQLQASSELFFDVFNEFDPQNLLLEQAKREVLEQQLEVKRLRAALQQLKIMKIVQVCCKELTPLAFPLWAESLRAQHVSSEKWTDRVKEMVAALENGR